MSNTVIVIIAVIIICTAVVVIEYRHNKTQRFHAEGLGEAVKEILGNQPGGHMKREDFLKALRKRYNCSPKESLYLTGQARKRGYIHQDGKYVTQLS